MHCSSLQLQKPLLQNVLQRCLLCGVALLSLSGYSPQCAAEDVTSQYFEQLRRRHLFSLAEGYCLTRLKKENLPVAQRARMTLELSRTFTEHANYLGGEEQADLWMRAETVLVDYLQKKQQPPGRMLLDIQLAKIPAAEANWYRWEHKIAPENEAMFKKGNTLFNRSILRWQQLQKHLDERLQLVLRKKKKKDSFSPYELRVLLNDVRLQYATTTLDHAELVPFGSEIRKQRLRDAEKPLQHLKNGRSDDVRTWHSRLQLARAGRLRHDFKTATAILRMIEGAPPPEQIIPALVAEEVHLLLTWNRPVDAVKLLSEKRKAGIVQTGALRYLNIQGLIATAKVAEKKQDSELAAGLHKQAEHYVKRATIEMGGFWGYRCQKLFDRLKQNRQYGEAVATLVRQARTALAVGQKKEAIDLFGKATIAANENGKKEVAMELGFKRASIQLQSKDNSGAAVSFIELATHFPQGKRAADAHLLGAYALGRIYLGNKSKKDREAYCTALEHHIQRYAANPTVTEAKWMYATLQEQLGQMTVAMKWYLQISADHKRGQLAQVAVARCYQFLLNRNTKSKQTPQKQQQMEQAAVTQLTAYIKAYPVDANKLSDRQAEVLLRLAQIELHRHQPDFIQADRWLSRIIESADIQIKKSSQDVLILPTWKPMKRDATQLRILSLAGQKKYVAAKQIIKKLARRNTTEVLGLLEGLVQVAAGSDKTTRIQIGQLQLQAAKELYLRNKKLSAFQLQQVEHALAEAFVATNDIAQARAFYLELIKKSPKDRKILKKIALLSQQCGTTQCLNDAKQTWQKLESLENPGTIAWLNARYGVAECCLLLHDTKECRKLVTITKILYPKLGNDELRKKFIALQQKSK